jgi:hypothetical protein
MGSKNRFSGSVKKKFYYLCGSIIINNYTFRGNIQNSKHYILYFEIYSRGYTFYHYNKNYHYRRITTQKRVSKSTK